MSDEQGSLKLFLLVIMANPTKEQQKAWREANKERRREYMLKWRTEHQEHVAEYQKNYQASSDVYRNWKRAYDSRYYNANKNDAEFKSRRAEGYKRWAEANPDKAKAKCDRYKERHREILAAKQREAYQSLSVEERRAARAARAEYFRRWREEHKEAAREYHQQYWNENAEQLREESKANYEAKRDEYIARAEKRQRQLQERGKYTAEDVQALYEKQSGKCAGCGKPLANSRDRRVKDCFEVDHVMPIALGGSNTAENLQLLCRPCNRRKHAAHPDEWRRINKLS